MTTAKRIETYASPIEPAARIRLRYTFDRTSKGHTVRVETRWATGDPAIETFRFASIHMAVAKMDAAAAVAVGMGYVRV